MQIRKQTQQSELKLCAQLMADSEPWITLKSNYKTSMKVLSDPEKELFLAYEADHFAGFIFLDMTGAFVGYIKSICIAPEFRNRGIGSVLIAFAEKRIFHDSPNVFICVSSFNIHAQRFYKNLDYKVVGELKDYLISGHSELLLRKTIAPISEFKNGAEEFGDQNHEKND